MSKSSSPWPAFIFFTLLTVFTAGLNVSMTQPTSGSRPTPATLQSLDFDLNAKTAVATVAIDGEPGSHRVDLSTATFEEIAAAYRATVTSNAKKTYIYDFYRGRFGK
jgi:hypothetical protein